MFGYVQPLKSELKVREFEQFKSCYCSMCHYLGKHYGPFSRMILNYDFTFLTMLLWDDRCRISFSGKRCIASPCRKKCVCSTSDSMDVCAACSVILAYWKLKDSASDEKGFKYLGALFARLGLYRAYKKAACRLPEFDTAVRRELAILSELEKTGEQSLDKMADHFAVLLSVAGTGETDPQRRRIVEQILYHTGRWIYILDAYDDRKEDLQAGRYNPISARFGNAESLSDEDCAYIRTTLQHSQNLIMSAFGLLAENVWTDILNNIICLGMSDVCERVFNGTYTNPKTGLPR